MAPEYSKAALGLYPLVPLYAIDCDKHKSLCAEQGVQGFPTVKVGISSFTMARQNVITRYSYGLEDVALMP